MKQSDVERTKLTASALDRISTACVTVGVLAPFAAAIYAPVRTDTPAWLWGLATLYWLAIAVGLHLLGHFTLKGLDND